MSLTWGLPMACQVGSAVVFQIKQNKWENHSVVSTCKTLWQQTKTQLQKDIFGKLNQA
jgi:hypothetical protein